MERLAYDDFEVVQRVGRPPGCRALLVGPTPTEPVVMPSVDVEGLRDLVHSCTRRRCRPRRAAGHAGLRAFGRALFEAVFRGAVLRTFRACLAAHRSPTRVGGFASGSALTDVPELPHLAVE